MKLAEIASRIDKHLKRFEADPKINACRVSHGNTKPYFYASAYARGRYVYVGYITYQGLSHLSKEQALIYLAWLDAGNVGRHLEALREQ